LTTAGKIRVLLSLLFASLLFTAIVVENTYTPANNLTETAKLLESNLHGKEQVVDDAINNKQFFNEVQRLRSSPALDLKYINEYTAKKGIQILVYKNDFLRFWSDEYVIPSCANLKEGTSFIKFANGYYETIKKTEGTTSVVFLILVKTNYAFTNEYLENIFSKDLTPDRNFAIADITDKDVYPIHNLNNTYLFSVKLVSGVNHHFFYLVVCLWLLAITALFAFVNNVADYLDKKGHTYGALAFLGAFIVVFRFINLQYGWPDFTRQLAMFNPKIYATSPIYRSLGDLCINILMLFWLVVFAYVHRAGIIRKLPGKLLSYIIFGTCVFSLIFSSTGLLRIFYGLVINSKISFDVNNILNLSGFSLIGVLMLCFGFLMFFLLTEVALTVCFKLDIPILEQALLFVTSIIITTAATTYYWEFSFFYLLWMLLVLMRGFAYLFNDQKFTASAFIIAVLICAVISAIKLNHFESVKEDELRKVLIQRLEVPDDATADMLFKKIEKKIVVDSLLVQYYKRADHSADYLETRLQKLYFDRYLAKYDFKVHEYDTKGQPISTDKNYALDVFKDMVVYSSFKVSDYFYRQNESFGFQSYFAILPVLDGATRLGTIVIELKSKPLISQGTFPDLLIDKEDRGNNDEFKNYSFAFYTDNLLIGQSGTYVYSLQNKEFEGKLKQYTEQTTESTKTGFTDKFTSYSHLLYKPSKRDLIVVSYEHNALLSNITALTFFFVVLLAFSAAALLFRILWIRVRVFYVSNSRIRWRFRMNLDGILYKTRIQFSMIFAVVVTLLLVGIITFMSISRQYQAQQDKLIRSKIMQIAFAFETGPIHNFVNNVTEDSKIKFDQLADTYSADLNLYDLNGAVLLSTQPKIYDYGLLYPQMNARAFVALSGMQKSEVVNEEKIGALTYKAAYVPIRNVKHQTVAYLQLPYFANAADYTERIGSLLNIMINVYALVFIAIGLFAVVIARQITAPLNFIQYNLSKTIYGKKNEPIKWERDDEIGALVKEYNNMIAALEKSAQKLAQSEREHAWREMAKQVAHEIKNPLTPLKLGLQLLDKSWRDKDPKFDQKFERFSKSFVEQIESLASIASEFSAFAKMPDTRIERMDIFGMLTQAVTIFKQMDNVSIVYMPPATPFYVNADRDQLLRCFNNLLKNAIEAAPPDNKCVITIDYLITTKNILLTIKDNGNGIPEAMREKIFEPNFTTKSSGTGLGLAFVKNSIENANGKVWFETAINVGTTFYLSFPSDNSEGSSPVFTG
jgi:two-component system nitrogen regulation sensor histidine kinase NtrY